MYKADPAAFWLPQQIREELYPNFSKIQDAEGFWNFTTDTIGDFVFYDELPEEGPDSTNLAKFLNEVNPATHAVNSKGRLYVGPMRMLQKRVKERDCKRNSTNPQYQQQMHCYAVRYLPDDSD